MWLGWAFLVQGQALCSHSSIYREIKTMSWRCCSPSWQVCQRIHLLSHKTGIFTPEWELQCLWRGESRLGRSPGLDLNWGGVRGQGTTSHLLCLNNLCNKTVPCFAVILWWFWRHLFPCASCGLLIICVISCLPGRQSCCWGRRQAEILHSGHQQHHPGVSAASREMWERRALGKAFLVNSGAGSAGIVGLSLYRSCRQNMPKITWKSPRNGFQLKSEWGRRMLEGINPGLLFSRCCLIFMSLNLVIWPVNLAWCKTS